MTKSSPANLVKEAGLRRSVIKDYEFSRWTMREHWDAGHREVVQTLEDPRWTGRAASAAGVRVFDLVDRAGSESTVKETQ